MKKILYFMLLLGCCVNAQANNLHHISESKYQPPSPLEEAIQNFGTPSEPLGISPEEMAIISKRHISLYQRPILAIVPENLEEDHPRYSTVETNDPAIICCCDPWSMIQSLLQSLSF